MPKTSFTAIILCFLLFQAFIKAQTLHDVSKLDDSSFSNYLTKYVDSLKEANHNIDFSKKLNSKSCINDLKILKRCLEESQTTLYRFTSKEKLDGMFTQAYTRLEEPITYLDYVRIIAKIKNEIACGHSGWSHNKPYIDYRNKYVKIFPFDIISTNSTYYIIRNNSYKNEIKPFDEIVEINGIPIKAIANEIASHMTADGNSNCGSRIDIQSYFPMAYSNFISNPDSFEIKLINNLNQAHIYKAQALPKKEVDSLRNLRYTDHIYTFEKAISFHSVIPDEFGLLRIKSFNQSYLKKSGQDFEETIDSIFNQLNNSKTKNLIIDLRGNTGGWTAYGNYLFSYFVSKDTRYMKSVETKKFENFSFEPIISHRPYYLEGAKLVLDSNNLYNWKNYPSLNCRPNDNKKYKGQVFILTDGLTRSCSGMFAALMKEHEKAVFIGEETGSTSCGSGGIVMSYTLPYSGIRIFNSTAMYTTAITDLDNARGTIPDYVIVPTSESVTTSEDLVMKQVLKLIKE